MSRTSMVLLGGAAVAAAACASPGISTTSGPVPSAASMAAGAITAEELRRDLTAFSADSMRGRETGTTDELRAARFIATRLAQLGVTPGGDSGYYQRVPLTSMRIAKHSSVTVATPGGVSILRIGGDIVPLTVMGVGAQNPQVECGCGPGLCFIRDRGRQDDQAGRLRGPRNGGKGRRRRQRRAARCGLQCGGTVLWPGGIPDATRAAGEFTEPARRNHRRDDW